MILTAPPQARQVSMSMPNTRFRRCAHVIAMDGMYAGLAGAKTGHRGATFARRGCLRIPRRATLASPAPFRRCYSRPVPAVGGEYAVEACQVDSGLGHLGNCSCVALPPASLQSRAASRAMKSSGSGPAGVRCASSKPSSADTHHPPHRTEEATRRDPRLFQIASRPDHIPPNYHRRRHRLAQPRTEIAHRYRFRPSTSCNTPTPTPADPFSPATLRIRSRSQEPRRRRRA